MVGLRVGGLGLIVLLAACQASEPEGNDAAADLSPLEQDLAYFSSLFDGEFSNIAAVLASDGEVSQRHYLYRSIARPDFGDHVVYVQQAYGAGNDPETIYRQRIYHSYADAERNELVTRIYNFPGDTAQGVRGAQYDPSKLATFSPDNMTVLPDGCEIFWNRQGEDIIGYQKPGVCKMLIPNTETTMLLADDLVLNAALFSTHTRATDLGGAPLFGDDAPSIMYRATIYQCDVTLGGATDLGAVRLHDQGGLVVAQGADGEEVSIRLRRKKAEAATSPLVMELLSATDDLLESATSAPSKGTFKSQSLSAQCQRNDAPWQG